MTMYHATTESCMNAIFDSREIRPGFDGIIYMTQKMEEAIRFIAIRCLLEPIYILEIEVPDDTKIVETFDHSEAFFKCRSYGYPEEISTDRITNVYVCRK